MVTVGDISNFLVVSLFGQTHVPDVDLASKTIIVTGGNTGLGFDCAKHLTRLNVSNLILACRDPVKGEAARAKILAEATNPDSTNIQVWQVDLDSYVSVLSFGDRVNTQIARLDGFVANAGLELEKFEISEGCERTLTVNVVSTMLMAYAVLPKLQQTSKVHKVQTALSLVGSLIHVMAPVKQLTSALQRTDSDVFASLSDQTTADMTSRYPLSKLLLHLCFVGLIEHMELQKLGGVTVNCVNPGWCKTSLSRARDTGVVERICAVAFQRTSEQGSRTLVHGVVGGIETHGAYLSECRVKPMSSFIRSQQGKEASKRVFNDLLVRLEHASAGVTGLKDRE